MLGMLFCMQKTTDEVWDPYRLVSLVHKVAVLHEKKTDEGWNLYKLVTFMVQIKSLFCKHKTTGYGLGLIESCYSCVHNVAMLCIQKPQIRVWDP